MIQVKPPELFAGFSLTQFKLTPYQSLHKTMVKCKSSVDKIQMSFGLSAITI